MRKLLSSLAISGLLFGAAAITAPAATAAPIDCKGNQEVTKVPRGGEFQCTNPGGGTPKGAEDPKNPNR